MRRRMAIWSTIAGLAVMTAVWMSFYLHPSAEEVVRHVKVKIPGVRDLPKLGNVRIFRSPAELRAAFPGATCDPAGAVDFRREDLVRIAWAGHFHEHKPHVWTARAGGRRLMFYEDAPSWGPASDCFCRVAREEWFAVPKGVAITVDRPGEVFWLDARMISMFLAMGLGTLTLAGRFTGRSDTPAAAGGGAA